MQLLIERSHRRASGVWPALLLACVWLVAIPRALAAEGDYDLYYELLMDKSKAGWMHLAQKTEGDRIRTTQTMEFRLRRGTTATSAAMSSEFIETTAGKPVSMRSSQRLGAEPMVVEYTFTEAGIEIVSDPAGARTAARRALPKEDWLTPASARSFVLQRLKAGAKEIVYRAIDPMSGPEIGTMTIRQIEKGHTRIGERTIEGFSMRTSESNAPGVDSNDFVDVNGKLVKKETTLGELSITIVAAGPEVAKADTGPGPEVMVSTFVRPDREITDPRRVSKAAYTLDYVSGTLPEVPETGSQTVTAQSGTRVTISVDTTMPHHAPLGDMDNDSYRSASAMIASTDDLVRELAEKSLRGAPKDDAVERAETLRLAVHDHITSKTLDVGFAGAAEIVRSRAGDCSEHAVLLAAVLRASGIPSRVAGGLIYAEEFAGKSGIFGYHMWTQALVEVDGAGRWIDLDATLAGNPGYDATHITLTISALGDADGSKELLGIASALGRVKVLVGDVEYRK